MEGAKISMDYEEMLTIKIAWYYYIENMTQQQISEKFGLSRMRVIKILEKAKKEGVIQFKIRQDGEQHMQVERELAKKWGLKDAFVVPSASAPEDINENVAKAAAIYIDQRISNNCFINTGYGDTLSRMINHLATMNEAPISVVSLTGGVSYYLPNTHARTFNVKLNLIPAPLLVASKEMVSAMRSEPSVSEIFRMVRLAKMTIIGIGSIGENATILKNGILSKNDFLYLSMKGAVGDILSHFIDENGNPIQTEIEDRLISTSLKALRELDNVIGVAAGLSKIKAIRAALRGKYLNILITDEETAKELIKD